MNWKRHSNICNLIGKYRRSSIHLAHVAWRFGDTKNMKMKGNNTHVKVNIQARQIKSNFLRLVFGIYANCLCITGVVPFKRLSVIISFGLNVYNYLNPRAIFTRFFLVDFFLFHRMKNNLKDIPIFCTQNLNTSTFLSTYLGEISLCACSRKRWWCTFTTLINSFAYLPNSP